jgi:hypothetical protein
MARTVGAFNYPDSGPHIMTLTGAGGQGITVTAASLATFSALDEPFNDQQIIHRTYREGQFWDIELVYLVSVRSIISHIMWVRKGKNIKAIDGCGSSGEASQEDSGDSSGA